MAGVQIDGVNNKIDFDDDLDTSISANTDDTLVIEAGGNTLATFTATTLTINDGTTITTADNTDTLTLKSTDADANSGPNLRLARDSSSPADGDVIGQILFTADDDAGNATDFFSISGNIRDASNGDEDVQMVFYGFRGGSSVNYLEFDGDHVVFNEGSADIDLRVESNNYTHCLFVDAAVDRVGIGENTSTPSYSLHVKDSQNDLIGLFHNNLSSGNVFGLQINFTSTVDDNTSYFFRCVGNNQSTVRAVIYSDGDIQNADNSYGSTSDERIKEQIKDANSQWDDIKALKIKNYKLKEDVADKGDSDDLWRLGVVAQDLEAAGMNGLVKPEVKLDAESPEVVNGEGKVGDIRDYKGVKYSILYMKAVKALQEAQTRIETLETKVATLEG